MSTDMYNKIRGAIINDLCAVFIGSKGIILNCAAVSQLDAAVSEAVARVDVRRLELHDALKAYEGILSGAVRDLAGDLDKYAADCFDRLQALKVTRAESLLYEYFCN